MTNTTKEDASPRNRKGKTELAPSRFGRPKAHGRRRRSVGLGVGWWLLLLLLGATPARAVDLDVMVGFGPGPGLTSRYRPDSWTPLTVYLTGTGVSGVAQLQFSVHVGNRNTLYTRAVTLHDGPTDQTAHFVFIPNEPMVWSGFRGGGGNNNSEIDVQLLMEGRKLAEKTVVLPIPMSSQSYNILALTRDGSGFNFLTKKRFHLLHRLADANEVMQYRMNTGEDTTTNTVLYSDSRALPEMAQGYDAIDAVILADLPPDTLTNDQQDALKAFVRDGGLLIVAGGGDISRVQSRFLADLLPLHPTGVQDGSLAALQTRYHQPFDVHLTTPMTVGALKPSATVLFTGGGLPLVTACPYGAGRVVFTAFDFQLPEFRQWKGGPLLWRDLFLCGLEPQSPRKKLQLDAQEATLYRVNTDQTLIDALAGLRASSTPNQTVIAIFLLAYILLLIPASYVILKKLDKREYAWITTPALVVGFTLTSYFIAQSIKGGLLSANRAVILETSANSDQAAGYGQMTLYSPSRTHYDITFASDDPNAPAIPFAPSELTPEDTLTIDQSQGTLLRDVFVRLWDKRSFDTPVPAHLGGPVTVQTVYLNNKAVRVKVTNNTRYALTGCALVNKADNVALPDLAPGQSAEAKMTWQSGENNNNLQLSAPTPSDAPTETQQNTRQRIRAGLVSALAGNNINNPYAPSFTNNNDTSELAGTPPNIFVGWFYDPVLDVRIDGQKPHGEEVNLLVVHLPIPDNAPEKLRLTTNPFLGPAPRSLPDVQPINQMLPRPK